MEKEVRINISVPEEIHYQLKVEAATERTNLKDKVVDILKNYCKTKIDRKVKISYKIKTMSLARLSLFGSL